MNDAELNDTTALASRAFRKRARSWGLLRPRRFFRHPKDAWPAGSVLVGVALEIFVITWPLPLSLAMVLAIVSFAFRMVAPIHQHGHAHEPVFFSGTLNRLYDFGLLLASGNSTALWRLHHVYGHHRDYLSRGGGLSGPGRFARFGRFQRLAFTVLGDAVSLADALVVARGLPPRIARPLLRQAFFDVLVVGLACAILSVFSLPKTGFVVLGMNLVLRWLVFYAAFNHHRQESEGQVFSAFESSITQLQSSAWQLHIGLHAAHHFKPRAHWSELPTLTKTLLPRLPRETVHGNVEEFINTHR